MIWERHTGRRPLPLATSEIIFAGRKSEQPDGYEKRHLRDELLREDFLSLAGSHCSHEMKAKAWKLGNVPQLRGE